jgi:hypothetical protein
VIRVLVLLAACAETTGPHLSSATPSASAHNTTVALAGERLCAGDCATAAGSFVFGLGGDLPSVVLGLVSLTDTSAQITIPDIAPAGTGDIVLTVNDSSSNALAFEVLP